MWLIQLFLKSYSYFGESNEHKIMHMKTQSENPLHVTFLLLVQGEKVTSGRLAKYSGTTQSRFKYNY